MAALVLVIALPYLSVRLANDFAGVPTWIRRAADLGFVLSAAIVLVSGTTRVTGVVYLVLCFVAAAAYSTPRFTAAAAPPRRRASAHAAHRRRLLAKPFQLGDLLRILERFCRPGGGPGADPSGGASFAYL